MDDRRGKTAGSGSEARGRRARLAAALRDNLRKRKTQARSRSEAVADTVAAAPEDGLPAASPAEDGGAPAGAAGRVGRRK